MINQSILAILIFSQDPWLTWKQVFVSGTIIANDLIFDRLRLPWNLSFNHSLLVNFKDRIYFRV